MESTLYWLNLTWKLSTPNKKALLLGHVNSWVNEVRPSVGCGTASDSQFGGKSYPPSSTVPSLMTKATSISSVASDATLAYRDTPVPPIISFPDSEDEGDAQDITAEDVDGRQVTTTLPV
ncbi:hypothetical protein PISMIDRAFT_20205 [Pisolithus microcarpus 441]|uniref:Uncharacterized protein n=1 Tax=Pisolithus microcarpus 441 TaxID=765257 RepID=A0A0C9Y0B7_9AGAM|nr:hypothetical protein BKA83DRAFT_20205 [Pisolithus microcarpus]KIK10646.1 hypothetical protein PISMIDRAFT_20205 [Pisolithus microcarpus 441]